MNDFLNDEVKFSGNKILRADNAKQVAWYTAYLNLVSAIVDFISERADSISDWTGKEDPANAEAAFKTISLNVTDFSFSSSGSA